MSITNPYANIPSSKRITNELEKISGDINPTQSSASVKTPFVMPKGWTWLKQIGFN